MKKSTIKKKTVKKTPVQQSDHKADYIIPIVLLAAIGLFFIAKSFASPSTYKKLAFSVSPSPTQEITPLDPSPSLTPAPRIIGPDIKSIVNHGSRNQKKIALTFDADMTPEMKTMLENGKVKSWYNKGIIDTLNTTHTKATIFLTGMWTEVYPDAAKEFANNPLLELANHTYSHPGFDGKCYGLKPAKPEEKDEEIEKTQKIIQDTTGVTPKFFRFPGGCYSKADLELVHKHGLIPVQWDVVGNDAFNKYSQVISESIMSETQNGSIIVLHINGGPNAPETNDVLSFVITVMKRRGYEFVTLSELLSEQ